MIYNGKLIKMTEYIRNTLVFLFGLNFKIVNIKHGLNRFIILDRNSHRKKNPG